MLPFRSPLRQASSRSFLGDRMRRLPRVFFTAALLIGTLLLGGCLQGVVTATLMPDGSGSIAVDLGYELRKWPPFLGDPYAGLTEREGLARWLSPGLIAWSQPTVRVEEGRRHLRTEVFFDEVDDVILTGTRGGQRIQALRLHRQGQSLHLQPGFLDLLDAPLPLPSPERVGLRGVTLSPELLEGIRQQIGAVIPGLDLRFELRLPGKVVRYDGLDFAEGRIAHLEIDADRATRAFHERAGVLVDEAALRSGDPRWAWEGQTVPPEEIQALARRARRAKAWWGGG